MSEKLAEKKDSTLPVMYNKVVQYGLTYGKALDEAIHKGKKISRPIWRGYWELCISDILTQPILVAVLRDEMGVVPATAYLEDMLATDWMIVE